MQNNQKKLNLTITVPGESKAAMSEAITLGEMVGRLRLRTAYGDEFQLVVPGLTVGEFPDVVDARCVGPDSSDVRIVAERAWVTVNDNEDEGKEEAELEIHLYIFDNVGYHHKHLRVVITETAIGEDITGTVIVKPMPCEMHGVALALFGDDHITTQYREMVELEKLASGGIGDAK